MRIGFGLLAIFLSVLVTGSVRSQPSGCDAETVNNFQVTGPGDRVIWNVPDMECVEFFNIGFSTPHGERRIRAIGDVNADALMPAGGIAAVEAGARDVVRKINDLGDYKVPNITILVTGVNPSGAQLVMVDGEGVWKHTNVAADANPGSMTAEGECPVRLFTLNAMNGDDMKQALAHEIFHCVQFGSLRPEQINGSAGWWIEGSADMFSNYVYPHLSDLFRREDSFRESVTNQDPIYQMDYAAVFLFLWYNDQTSIAGLVPLLQSMPSSSSASAQRGALRGMLAPEQWLEFAEAYEDGKIRYPDGMAAEFGAAVDGETWTISTTSNHDRTLKSFVITPGWANYECGLWGNRLTPANSNVALKVEGEENWTPYPAETDCRESRSIRYRSMAIHTGDANSTLALRAERRVACENCLGGETAIDPCMVGTWEQTGGGPVEWMRRNGVPITRDNVGRLRLTLRDDGTVLTQPVGIDMQMTIPDRDGPIINQSNGGITGIGGRWSAERGQVKMCVDSGGQASGTTVSTYPNGMRMGGPFGYNSGTGGSASYTCSGDSMRTINRMPRGGDMVYEFTRVSATPR